MRYEYHYGEVFAMAGGTINHSTLCMNASYLLKRETEKKKNNCRTFNSEIKIEVVTAKRYVYPDAAVVCGKLNESDTIKGAVRNPRLIVEVTSEDSGNYDRGDKMRYYLSIPTVREYLIIDQDTASVTLYRREKSSDLGQFHYADGLDSEIILDSLGISISLGELYENVTLTDKPD
jgi:Uma2 family endonuclease